jgi:hypothetical protein
MEDFSYPASNNPQDMSDWETLIPLPSLLPFSKDNAKHSLSASNSADTLVQTEEDDNIMQECDEKLNQRTPTATSSYYLRDSVDISSSIKLFIMADGRKYFFSLIILIIFSFSLD